MKKVAIINPYASGSYLYAELKRHKIATVALYTAPCDELPEYVRESAEVFDKQIFLKTANLEDAIEILRAEEVSYVINGFEHITWFTDLINEKLLPEYANSPSTSSLRQDKSLQTEILKKNDISHIKQIVVNINQECLSTIEQHIGYPCFMKPKNGTASIGTYIANTRHELLEIVDLIKSTQNSLVSLNEYIVQEVIVGEEIVVDSFSFNGEHYISVVARYEKSFINKKPVYRYVEIVEDQKIWDMIAGYTKSCLNVIGLNNGFAHTELFRLQDGSFRLIEVNPRISGGKGIINKMATACNLKNQVDLFNEVIFNKNFNGNKFLSLSGYARALFVFKLTNTKIKEPAIDNLDLNSLVEYNLLATIGSISKTKSLDITGCAMIILLYNINKRQLEKDTATLFRLEESDDLI
ncbi:MAG: argininosuccinate lyase [Burkholderiales bacterium]|jgi:biotin carboxylase|nr:argininosuccinate lyase [Burkholderiales bacterium]